MTFIDWEIIIELVDILVWPIATLFALFTFRKPLATFLSGLSGRLSKLSAFDISIELAELPQPPTPWNDPTVYERSEMIGGDVSSTALMTLFEQIGRSTKWDYLIVDIKDGHFWLVSRVFIFTVLLQAMRNLKCVVFVESTDTHRQRLIGLASPDAIRATLNTANPWLEQALTNAKVHDQVYYLHRSLQSDRAGMLIRTFIEDPEMRKTTAPFPPDDWTQLGTESIWEHTRWLTLDETNRLFRKSFFEWDASTYKALPDTPSEQKTKDLIRRKSPFIALINSKGEFQQLVDRQKLVTLVGEATVNAA